MRQPPLAPFLAAACALTSAPVASAVQDTTRVSVDSAGVEGNGESALPTPSPDGRFVAISSDASNLVAGDGNGVWDLFVRDLLTGVIERVSVDSNGNEANDGSWSYSQQVFSSDGRLVVFDSIASNLVANDSNVTLDVFVHDRSTGTTTRVSVDSAGVEGDDNSYWGCLSADGRFVAFQSKATNLVAGDTNARMDVFVHELATGVTERMSVDSAGNQAKLKSFWPSISDDGRFVCFTSNSNDLVPGDTGRVDTFVRDRLLGTTEQVSVDSSGNPGNGNSVYSMISGDGRYVVFSSGASNLVASDTNNTEDVFVHDRTTGTTVIASVDSSGNQAQNGAEFPVISGNGRIVGFDTSSSDLVPGDTNQRPDAFVHDMVTGATIRVSVDSAGTEGNDSSWITGLSADGRLVGFDSVATNLVVSDTNGVGDSFIHELCSTPSNWTNYGAGFPGTNGVPPFTAQQLPAFGATVTVDLANSLGAPTVGLLVVGLQRASIPTKFGGTLLALPLWIAPLAFGAGAEAFTGTIPDDFELCGVTIDLQGIETDAGAAHGLSFSQGLELTIGN